MAKVVNILEPVSKFTAALHNKPGFGNIYNVRLEGWQPAEGVQYDLIWVQWCAMYVPDNLLLEFINRRKAALHPEGMIVFKENTGTVGYDICDDEDSSVTRKGDKIEALFEEVGWQLVRKDLQKGSRWLAEYRY